VRAEMQPWIDMVGRVLEKTRFPDDLDTEALRRAFIAHNEAVKATIPAGQLLVYDVKQGWAPLCEFLGVPVPDEPFPRSNDRREFWDRVSPALSD
jgi:Sulfotransferase domain